jgi:MFS family permease
MSPAAPIDLPLDLAGEPERVIDALIPMPTVESMPDEPEVMVDASLRKNRDFRVVLVGQGISALGDAVNVTTMPLLVLALTGSGLQMGVVGMLQRLPDLLFGLPAGAYADRWDRRRMMLLADAGRAILTALIPLASVLGWPVMGVILLVSFPINFCRVISMAGWTAAIPNLVGRRQLGLATGAFEAIGGGSFIVGPAIAGLLVGQIGAGPTLAIDAVSFGVSAVSLMLIRRPLQKSEPYLVVAWTRGVTQSRPGEFVCGLAQPGDLDNRTPECRRTCLDSSLCSSTMRVDPASSLLHFSIL